MLFCQCDVDLTVAAIWRSGLVGRPVEGFDGLLVMQTQSYNNDLRCSGAVMPVTDYLIVSRIDAHTRVEWGKIRKLCFVSGIKGRSWRR